MTDTRLLSRIAYNSVYAVLGLILGILLLIVPGDFIRFALKNKDHYINLIVIAIVYVITILVVLFIYVLRLNVTRTVLASIPNRRIPIEKSDVNKEVRNMIVKSLSDSAAIAWEARPKVLAPSAPPSEAAIADTAAEEIHARGGRRSLHLFRSKPPAPTEGTTGISPPAMRPAWGDVEHHGWGPPASSDLANLQYDIVLAELPNLIEAKAVTQAPTDPDSPPTAPLLDADAVMLLQRVPNMTVRSYITHLTELEVLPSSQDLIDFLDLYENARFSGRPMSNAAFRRVMHLFAELLRAMRPLRPSIFYDLQDDRSSRFSSDGYPDDDAAQYSSPTTPTPSPSLHSIYSFDRGSMRSHQRLSRLVVRNSSVATRHQYRTAPTTPRSIAAGGNAASRSLSSASSASSFAQSHHRVYLQREASTASLGSTSQGSVIRLATTHDSGSLPYVLRLTDTL